MNISTPGNKVVTYYQMDFMARPKEIKDGVRLSLVLSKKQAERVKYMALQMSKQEGRQITVSESIRMAVEAAYPVPKNQLDLLEG